MHVQSSTVATNRATAGLVLDDFLMMATNAGNAASNSTTSPPVENSGILGVGEGVGSVVDSFSVFVAEGGVLLGLVFVVAAG